MAGRATVAGRRVTTPCFRLPGPEGPRRLPAEAGTPTGRSVPVRPRVGVSPEWGVDLFSRAWGVPLFLTARARARFQERSLLCGRSTPELVFTAASGEADSACGRELSTLSLPRRRFRTGRNACPPCPHTPTCFLVPARSMRPAHSCSKPSAARAISRSALLVVRLNTVRRCIVVFPKCHRAYEGMIRHPVPMRQCIPGSSRITPHFQDPP